MGNGTIPAKKMRRVICEAFEHSDYEIYIASSYLKKEDWENVHIAPRWDVHTLLDEAVLFIQHGGQNSMVEGLCTECRNLLYRERCLKEIIMRKA